MGQQHAYANIDKSHHEDLSYAVSIMWADECGAPAHDGEVQFSEQNGNAAAHNSQDGSGHDG